MAPFGIDKKKIFIQEEILEKVKNLKIFKEYIKEITTYLKKQKLI